MEKKKRRMRDIFYGAVRKRKSFQRGEIRFYFRIDYRVRFRREDCCFSIFISASEQTMKSGGAGVGVAKSKKQR